MRIGNLTKVFTAELVDAAIAKHDRAERRRRLLPARLVVYFVLALCLFARESYDEVGRWPVRSPLRTRPGHGGADYGCSGWTALSSTFPTR
ncbi:transposase domain-containing protein [Streptomyces sp. LN325]|uniref:transposase domain-containing protein n=1 Tax=Streptomyces sp. LN325 TaxID=3112976 RepID=UPI003721718C